MKTPSKTWLKTCVKRALWTVGEGNEPGSQTGPIALRATC